MWIGIRKRIVSTVALLAFIAAALAPLVPHAAAATIPCVMLMASSSMADDHSPPGERSSKEALPPCGTDLRCIVAAALPEAVAPTSTHLAWQPVRYWTASRGLPGISIPPDISPPRSHA